MKPVPLDVAHASALLEYPDVVARIVEADALADPNCMISSSDDIRAKQLEIKTWLAADFVARYILFGRFLTEVTPDE